MIVPPSTSRNALTERRNAPITPAMATYAAFSLRYLPNSPAIRKPANGRSGISAYLSIVMHLEDINPESYISKIQANTDHPYRGSGFMNFVL